MPSATLPEKTTQLDAGVVHAATRLSVSLAVFYGKVEDYILIESGYPKGTRSSTITRNVDATTWGGEADAVFALTRWR